MTIPAAEATTPIASITSRAEDAWRRICFSSPAPKSWAISTDAPAEKPFASARNTMVSTPLAPTAARGASPAKFPTTMVSTVL